MHRSLLIIIALTVLGLLSLTGLAEDKPWTRGSSSRPTKPNRL
jgi:hypothetical protein